VEADLRPVVSALRSVESTRRTVESDLRSAICRCTVTSGLFVRWRCANGVATGDLHTSYGSVCHVHAAHRVDSRHVLLVRREQLETWLTVYRAARLLDRSDRRLAVIKCHEVVAIGSCYGGLSRLHWGRAKMSFARRKKLDAGRPCRYSAPAIPGRYRKIASC
jgi:hypothetical protein